MKKMISVIIALAMVAVFLPQANAEDSANLALSVTFDINHTPVWVTPPQDASVIVGNRLIIGVLASDEDPSDSLTYGCKWVNDSSNELPSGAVFEQPTADGLARLVWDITGDNVPPDGSSGVYDFEFSVTDSEGARISAMARVTIVPAEISIQLEGEPWILTGIELNTLRRNIGSNGEPMHKVKSLSNVPVDVEIRYVLPDITIQPRPGTAQGPNTFITKVGYEDGAPVLPPSDTGKIVFATDLKPDMSAPLPLTYGSPTEVLEGITGMSVQYTIIANSSVTR